MQAEDWKRELVELLFARVRLIGATTLAIFAGSVYIAFSWPPTFAASGSVMVRGIPVRVSPEALQTPELRNLTISKEDIATEVAILTSPDLIRRVVGDGDESQTAERVRRIRASLATEIVPTSHVIEVSLSDRDPAWAEKTLDALLKQYLGFRAEVFHPSGQETFLNTRALQYKQDLEQIEDRLVKKAQESSVTLADREMANNSDLARDLKRRLNELQIERVQLEREVAPLRKAVEQKEPQYFAFLGLEAIDNLAGKLKDLRAEYARLERAYKPDSERMQAIERNIRDAYEDLRAEARRVLESRSETLESVRAREQEVETAIAGLEKRNVELQAHATEVLRMNREAGLLTFSYETFSKRAEEARINSAIASANFSGEVSILSWPQNSSNLVFPKKGITLALGLFVGLVAGFSLGFLAEFLDHTFKRPADVLRFARLPVIFSIRRV